MVRATIPVPLDRFSKINGKFKGVITGDILQTVEMQRDILEVIKVRIQSDKLETNLKEMVDFLEDKMLHLSYKYNLWDLYLCWCELPVIHPYIDISNRTEGFTSTAILMIYKETPRPKI